MAPDRRSFPGRAYRWAIPLIVIVLVIALSQAGGTRSHGRVRDSGRAGALDPSSLRSPSGDSDPVWIRATLTGAARSPLPRSFLGLSFEYWDLASFDTSPPLLERTLDLIRVPGDGPLLLRIGGDSADQSYWGGSPGAALGPWPYRLTPRWLRALASLVRGAHLHLLVDLNLVERSPTRAARFARALLRALPPHTVTAFEIGNEPDIYHHWVDYHLSGPSALFAAPSGWDRFSPGQYARAFAAYAQALGRVAPQVPLAGPETAYPERDLAWERRLLATSLDHVGLLTIHRYPLSGCPHSGAGHFSTIARVLSVKAASGLKANVDPALRLAQDADVPLRMTELNSVNCEGVRGVSNTFATALWAPDALFSLWQAGLAGVNVHVRQGAANGAFAIAGRRLIARPLLYGLSLFARAVGRRGELAALRVEGSAPSVRLWAVRGSHWLNVLVLDKGPHPAHVALRLPSTGVAVIQRLLAPSVRATGGVTLAGQHLSARGVWTGGRALGYLRPGSRGRYRILVRPYSAALLSFRI